MPDISRAEVASLIQEAYSNDLLTGAKEASTVLQAFPTVSMGTKTTHMPVLAALPEAGWVSESATAAGGVKPQSEAAWQDRTLVAEEIAVIIPVHENVLDDASTDVLSEISALGGQAIGKKLDQAVLLGTDKPASWVSPALFAAATAAGQQFARRAILAQLLLNFVAQSGTNPQIRTLSGSGRSCWSTLENQG